MKLVKKLASGVIDQTLEIRDGTDGVQAPASVLAKHTRQAIYRMRKLGSSELVEERRLLIRDDRQEARIIADAQSAGLVAE